MAGFSRRLFFLCAGAAVALVCATLFVERSAALEPARLMYARELAERSAVLSLEGTDLSLLKDAINRLESAEEALVHLQSTNRASRAVAFALYPISYLRQLAHLEETRRAFVHSGGQEDYRAYSAARKQALKEAERSLNRFERGYRDFAGGSYDPTVTLGGKLTKEHTLLVLSSIRSGYEEVRLSIDNEKVCLSGNLSKCPTPEEITFETVPRAEKQEEYLELTLPLYEEGLGFGPRHKIFALTEAVCLRDITPVFIFSPRFPSDGFIPYLYVGDLFFNPLKDTGRGQVLQWFKDNGVEHLIYNPLTFYTCPDVGADISRTEALSDIAAATGSTDASARTLYESDIIDSLVRSPDSSSSSDRAGLYRGYRDGSAGFEQVVGDVAHGLESLLSMHLKGIPVDTSAEFLFSTHSGYYSLFLAHNKTARSSSPSPYVADTEGMFFKRFLRYSDAPAATDQKSLIHDVSVFIRAHL